MPELPLAEFIGVEKTYDGVINVVKSLDLEVRQGEFLTLLGPSGSGKTTTLMMLAGFEDPTAGDILLKQKSLQHVPPFARNIGVVFQNYALFPHMSVAGNIAFPLIQRRIPKAQRREKVREALDMVELGALARRRPRQLSGGQQQRVALARALVFEPDLVLMDEPLGALDKNLREQMQLEIKRLHDQLGMTVVYVTHDQGEALTMSDRVAIFHDGVIQQIDAPQSVYESPANPFVADFVGENNAIPGTVSERSGGFCTVSIDDGDATVRARCEQDLALGERTLVSVRPERIRLAAKAKACDNVQQARIAEVIYLGDQFRVHLTLPNGVQINAKLSMSDVESPLQPDQPMVVGWDAVSCRALATAGECHSKDPQATFKE